MSDEQAAGEREERRGVLVQVVDADVHAGRQISSRGNIAQQLSDRIDDIRDAIKAGSESVAESLPSIATAEGWECGEVTASFGVTLTVEGGVIVSKATAGATFDVTVKFARTATDTD